MGRVKYICQANICWFWSIIQTFQLSIHYSSVLQYRTSVIHIHAFGFSLSYIRTSNKHHSDILVLLQQKSILVYTINQPQPNKVTYNKVNPTLPPHLTSAQLRSYNIPHHTHIHSHIHHHNGSRRIQRCCVQVPLPLRHRLHAHHPSLLRPRRIQLDGALRHPRRHSSQPRSLVADDNDANRPGRFMAAHVQRLGMMDPKLHSEAKHFEHGILGISADGHFPEF